MNTLLFAHIAVGILLAGLTSWRLARVIGKKPRHKRLDSATALAVIVEGLSGFGLVLLGASIAHMCMSGTVMVAIIAGVEVYIRQTVRRRQTSLL